MKTEWEFFFETRDFVFEKEHKYRAKKTGLGSSDDTPGNLKEISFELKITPDKERKSPGAEQTGSLFITLPHSYEKALSRLFTQGINVPI